MGDFYLRIEAVNLANTVYDTYDISTIRGGSFMLLDAIDALEDSKRYSVAKKLTCISKGASTGLYNMKNVKNDDGAKKIVEEVKKCLKAVAHDSTFVVSYHKVDDNPEKFQEGVKMLMAKNRWLQFQQPTVILPNAEKTAKEDCTLDGIRPGFKKDRDEIVSTFTFLRRDFGRELKKTKLYEKLLKQSLNKTEFTNDLDELSRDKTKGSLNGKIAFIYMDGNKFGSIRDKLCTTSALLKNFDEVVQQNLRATILKKILDLANSDIDFKNGDRIRLEILLWGGDDLEMIVPSWMGRRVLDVFYGVNETFAGKDKNNNSQSKPLTHSCGVVFCHHNAPILQIRKLARKLSDKIKEKINDELQAKNPKDPFKALTNHEQGDCIQYLVLESIDMLGSGLERFNKEYYSPAKLEDLQIKGNELSTLQNNLAVLRKNFPHNKVYDVIKTLRKEKDVEQIIERGLEGVPKSQKLYVQNAINSIVNGKPYRWFLIADLWDYFKE